MQKMRREANWTLHTSWLRMSKKLKIGHEVDFIFHLSGLSDVTPREYK